MSLQPSTPPALAGIKESLMKLREVGRLLRITAAEWWNDNTFRLAAAVAFYTIFSLAPVLVITVAVGGLVTDRGSDEVRAALVEEIARLVGDEGGDAVEQVLGSAAIQANSPLAALLGVVTVLIGSTFVFVELQAALNEIWDVKPAPTRSMIRGFLSDRLRSFGVALGVGFVLVVSLVMSAFLNSAEKRVDRILPGVVPVWQSLNALVSLLLVALLFALVYKYLPDVKIRWTDVAIGSLVTAALFSVGKYLIGVYLGRMAFGSVFGSAGSFVVFLVWIYYSALICFFGAEFTHVYARRYGSHIEPQEYAVRIGRKSRSAGEN